MSSAIEKHIEAILVHLGENILREGLKETPRRFQKTLEYLTSGYQDKLCKIVKNAIFQSDINEIIIVRSIELYSLCEHHLLPFIGKCHVAYLPNGKIIGISKISRIVDMYSRRFQVQENLTKQIAESIAEVTDAKGVGVIIEAKHLCMMMRGVKKQNPEMITFLMLGAFCKDDRARTELLNLIKS
ncbi:GTP cyclohydrolase I FolE [Coxiella endosymbiont of Amblyomma americanum]|uniref:GTP cyclohydrolase I FolE n=1 Tax=Coxiella endosymbiont of Amblyomma americanum TaxID=325775 RepID=UPI00057F5828|nr:GTP cyclohydrolase I FolE [Coxiella endosymbiont of Amblyomma americanum]AJC50540.1 GTP cyclohydrolase [Coxiella endosymbiont of Amblyomma americanum]AUJ58874.1 GTP cyclohydrolase I FolE [Coxiella-like endosymbiont of Amblyomma americanum]